MDRQARMHRCPNCGTRFGREEFTRSGPGEDAGHYICPTCDFHVTDNAPVPRDTALTGDELQARLASLLTSARIRGVSSQTIVCILRDELAFEAELNAPGHRILVQIFDLGQFEPASQPWQSSQEPERLHSRNFGH